MNKPNSIVFPHLPYNTDRVYIRGICHNGCEVYLPVTKNHDAEHEKQLLQEWLDNQPMPEDILA